MFRSSAILMLIASLLFVSPAEARRRSRSSNNDLLIQLLSTLLLGGADLSAVNPFGITNSRAISPFSFGGLGSGLFPFGNPALGFGNGNGGFANGFGGFGNGFGRGFGNGFGRQFGNGFGSGFNQFGNFSGFGNGFGGFGTGFATDRFGFPTGSGFNSERGVPTSASASSVGPHMAAHSDGDTTPSSSRSLTQPRAEGSREGICGNDAYDAVCRDALANAPRVTAEVTKAIDAKISDALDNDGKPVSTEDYSKLMQYITKNRSVPRGWQLWYGEYLDRMVADFDISDLAQQQKRALIDAIAEQPFDANRAAAIRKIENAKVMTRPDFTDPQELDEFLRTCGAANRTDNAFACPFHSHGDPLRIFVCGGRLEAAKARAGGNPNLVKVDLSHTIAHELGHLVGHEQQSPFKPAFSSFLACESKEHGNHPDAATFNSEKTADLLGNLVIRKNIERGETQGIDAAEYAKLTMTRLCGTAGDHPPDYERVRNLVRTLRSGGFAREVMGCSSLLDGESTCTLTGRRSGG